MEFDMQKLYYFTEGNGFTGSRSDPNGSLLRYRVEPDKENGQLLAWSWKEDKCFERANDKREGAFPMTEEGLAKIQAWLAEDWTGSTEDA